MASLNNYSQTGPRITEPTEDEITRTISDIKQKYDIIITSDEAIEYAKLTKEFNWWFELEQALGSSEELKKELIDEIKNEVKAEGHNTITDTEASSLLSFRIQKEKRSASEKAAAIIAKHME